MSNVVCGILGSNTGKPQCDVPIGAIKYLLPSRGATFTEAELTDSTTIKAALLAKMLLPRTDNQKIYLIPYANEVDDNTGDPNIGTLSDGFEQILNDALPKYIMRYAQMGKTQNQAICSFNGWRDKIYFIDRNNRFCYITISDNTAKGFSVGNLHFNPPKPGGSNEVTTTTGRITFGSVDEFKSSVIGLIDLSFNVEELVNLEDVNVVQKAAPVSNVHTVGGVTKYGGIDIYASYKTAMNQVARFSVLNESTGAAITLDSVATDDPNKGWDLTINSAAFTALASGTKYSINFAPPATLDSAGVKGIEGIKIVYTKP